MLSCRNDPSSARRKIFALMNSDYRRTLISITLGNMFVNSGISMLNDELLLRMNLHGALGTLLSVLVAVLILLLFGEITPMTAAYIHADAWSVRV